MGFLPRKEFELFSLLTSKPGKVFKRDTILDSVWGNEVVVGGRTIDVHIRKLREKIGDDSFKTVKGVGYKFAFLTSILITIILSLINGIYFLAIDSFYIWFYLSEVIIVFLISFFIIQYRVENFIYKRMKKIYDDVSLLDVSTLGRQKITTNMETLTKEVELF